MKWKFRWVIVGLIFLIGALNYADRAAFSVAAPMISKEFHLDAVQMGLILGSFSIGYALFNFVGGYLADRFGPRKVMAGALAGWSAFVGLTSAGFNFISFYILRLLFGFAEGPIATTSNKMANQWLPARERASAIGLYTSGMLLGGAAAGPIVGLLSLRFGWRTSFVVLTVVGLLLMLLWLKTTTDYPAQHPRVSKEELDEIQQDQGSVQSGNPSDATPNLTLWSIIRRPTILFTAVAFFAYNYNNFFFLTWFPSYLTKARHLSIHDMSFATAIPWLIGAIGLMCGGILSDALYRKTGKLMFSRKVVLAVGLFGAAVCIGVIGSVNTALEAVTLMAVGAFFLYLTAMIYWAIIQDTVPSKYIGSAGGFVHLVSNISGIIAPTVTGILVQRSGNFSSAFFLAGGLAVVGALATVFLIGRRESRA
ncbi:MFS transporter [Alicyclobacillus macrosporangiidus]|uniref:MFS transporter, ACS family, hexuronate transporter n=1 Tax=Alicyclobacillus macrosporangiidus TaxID=392015 RepID=A0A1I7JJ08_9BACL|nr:MFS transporter [Alicyclobacillus macrosporangiidus]SFU85174.1 MFS transporter, ACS family, hexuronate transporter [Alicyclobacillus macrosporangiidus]